MEDIGANKDLVKGKASGRILSYEHGEINEMGIEVRVSYANQY